MQHLLGASNMVGGQPSFWAHFDYARIESPDQTLHLSQLASVHAHWTVSVEAAEEEETGPRISAVAVESNPKNMHLFAEAPLFRKDKVIVAREALALQFSRLLQGVLLFSLLGLQLFR